MISPTSNQGCPTQTVNRINGRMDESHAEASLPQLAVSLTPQLRTKLEALLPEEASSASPQKGLLLEDREAITRAISSATVPLDVLEVVRAALSPDGRLSGESAEQPGLKELISGAKLLFPSSQAARQSRAPSIELIERRKYLKLKQQSRDYNLMVHGTADDPNVTRELDRGNQLSASKNHMSIISNIVVSTLASFAIAYFAGQQTGGSPTTCLVYGLAGAILILIVEIGLYVVRAVQMEKVYDAPSAKLRGELAQRSGGLNISSAQFTPAGSKIAGRTAGRHIQTETLPAEKPPALKKEE
jgi:hypothetical protein